MKSRRQCYLRRREEEEGGRRMEKRAPPAAVVALAAFFSEKEAEKLSAKGQLKVNEGRESRKTDETEVDLLNFPLESANF